MERLKKAIEKAREERSQLSNSAESTPEETVQTATTNTSVVDQSSIAYTRTQRFQLHPALMEANRILLPGNASAAASAYKILRTQVLQRLNANEWNALAVTSPGANEGKTLTAINLAISLSQEVRHTVLLVDLNLRSPDVHKKMGCDVKYGISDYLFNDTPLEEILINPSIEGMVVLPGNKPIENSSEILSSPRIIDLVNELKARYPSRIVVFDLPALLNVDDVLAFSPFVDAFLLVVQEFATTKDELNQALHLLESSNLIGTALNISSAANKP